MRVPRLVLVILAVAVAGTLPSQLALPSVDASPEVSQSFLENRGQWPSAAAYRTRAAGAAAWFDHRGWWIALERTHLHPADLSLQIANPLLHRFAAGTEGVALRMSFEGSATAELSGLDQQAGRYNFFVGQDRSRWATGVRAYERLHYRSVYPGIDMIVRGSTGLFEYDLELAPGARVEQVVVHCAGVDGLEIGADGALVLHTAVGDVVQSPPVTWHELPDGGRRPTTSRYRVLGDGRYGFAVDDRDPRLRLVIDPDLRWNTYLGGTDDDRLYAMDRGAGYTTVTGQTTSINFPAFPGSYQPINAGSWDVFVSRLDPAQKGSAQLVWSTYFGGSAQDLAFDVAVDPTGAAVFTGLTFSSNLPTTPNAWDPTFNGAIDAFVARLDPNGSSLMYSTYLGGGWSEYASAVLVDPAGGATVAGYTRSPSLPTTANAYDPTFNGAANATTDIFVASLDPSGSVTYLSYLGGSGAEGGVQNPLPSSPVNMQTLELAQRRSGEILIGANSGSSDYPTTPNAYSSSNSGRKDVAVTVLDLTKSGPAQLSYSTLLGGTENESSEALAFTLAGEIVVSGWTYSTGFPTTPGSYNQTHTGQQNDAFFVRLDPSQTGRAQLTYGALMGGDDWESGWGLDVDARGFATVGGFCGPGFPSTPGAFQPVFAGNQDGWLLKLNMAGQGTADLQYCTFLGGTGYEGLGRGVANDGDGGAWFAGLTDSLFLPTVGNPYQSTMSGPVAGFVGQMDMLPANVARGEGSSGHCQGKVIYEVSNQPVAPGTFSLLLGNAPKAGAGGLLFSASTGPCITVLGADLCLAAPMVAVPVMSDPQGTLALTLTAPASWAGLSVATQCVWINNTTCSGSQPLSSTATLTINF